MASNDAHEDNFWTRSTDNLRNVVDEVGRNWEVYEMIAPKHDRRGGLVLVFASQELVRRTRDYPDNWYELESAALLAIKEGHA